MNKKILSLFVVILYLVLFVVSATAQQERPVAKDESLRKGETRATLDPNLFKDARVKSAYQAAREVPWLLDSLICYCGCEESFHHKSLLSCYVDDHAAG